MYPAFTFFSSSSDIFSVLIFWFRRIHTYFTEEVDFNFETYLPAPITVLAPRPAVLFSQVHV
jgi:hypothetical protein